MPLDIALASNQQNPLRTAPSVSFASKGVLHVVLDVIPAMPLQFELKYVGANGATDAEQYVKKLPASIFSKTENPFDIVLDETNAKQQWIVVQLGGNADWCFTAGDPVTCKATADGRVFDPHWVDSKGVSWTGPIPIGESGCKVIWFGLAQLDRYASLALNYHVTISQTGKRPDGSTVVKSMPIIFDPDVRNDGDDIP